MKDKESFERFEHMSFEEAQAIGRAVGILLVLVGMFVLIWWAFHP